jgi:hypothetical protein
MKSQIMEANCAVNYLWNQDKKSIIQEIINLLEHHGVQDHSSRNWHVRFQRQIDTQNDSK